MPFFPPAPVFSDGGTLDLPFPAMWVSYRAQISSKSNHRNNPRNPRSWESLKDFERALSVLIRSHRPALWLPPDKAVPLASRPRAVAVMWARTLLDSGNLPKSVLDATEGLLVATDAEYRTVFAAVERAREDQCVMVAFAQLPPASDLLACHDASVLLSSATAPDTRPVTQP